MFLSSGGDDGNNNKLLFLLLSMVFFLSLFISPVYAEEVDKFGPEIVTNISIDRENIYSTLNFDYNNKSYSVPVKYYNPSLIDTSKFDFIFYYGISSSGPYLDEIYCITSISQKDVIYDNDLKKVNFTSMYALCYNSSSKTWDDVRKISKVVSLSLYNGEPGSHYFGTSTMSIPSSSGGYFFRVPSPTIIQGVKLEGVLTQVLYLLPSCLLWIASYLALRKCLTFLLALLKTS